MNVVKLENIIKWIESKKALHRWTLQELSEYLRLWIKDQIEDGVANKNELPRGRAIEEFYRLKRLKIYLQNLVQ